MSTFLDSDPIENLNDQLNNMMTNQVMSQIAVLQAVGALVSAVKTHPKFREDMGQLGSYVFTMQFDKARELIESMKSYIDIERITSTFSEMQELLTPVEEGLKEDLKDEDS